jgi:two-component sensor histidine kinase
VPLDAECAAVGARDVKMDKGNEELLRSLLAEREELLREVQHRVKNNLQIILSIVSLQESSFGSEADKELGRDTQARIRSMAYLYDLLSGSRNFLSIDSGEYLQAIAGSLSASYRGALSIRVDAQSDILSVDEAMPFGIIATELLTNAVKHAYSAERRREIYVRYRRTGGERRLEVRDEGIGLPSGFDPAKSDSLGLALARSLAQQIGGRLSLAAAEPETPFPGLRAVLTFTIPPQKSPN